jgi:adapter protein MecA 1/2
MLTKNTFSVENARYFEALLNEYGKKISNTTYYEGYLEEYATKIVEYNAVEVISSYF